MRAISTVVRQCSIFQRWGGICTCVCRSAPQRAISTGVEQGSIFQWWGGSCGPFAVLRPPLSLRALGRAPTGVLFEACLALG